MINRTVRVTKSEAHPNTVGLTGKLVRIDNDLSVVYLVRLLSGKELNYHGYELETIQFEIKLIENEHGKKINGYVNGESVISIVKDKPDYIGGSRCLPSNIEEALIITDCMKTAILEAKHLKV